MFGYFTWGIELKFAQVFRWKSAWPYSAVFYLNEFCRVCLSEMYPSYNTVNMTWRISSFSSPTGEYFFLSHLFFFSLTLIFEFFTWWWCRFQTIYFRLLLLYPVEILFCLHKLFVAFIGICYIVILHIEFPFERDWIFY